VEIYQNQKNSNQDEDLYYKTLLESSVSAGREREIRKLLQEQEWIKKTIEILTEN
jgi:hypothetical protein